MRGFWVSALLLVAGALAGVGGTLWYLGKVAPRLDGSDSRLLSAAAPEAGVVCFGHVDVEGGVTALTPVTAGRVTEVPVRENQEVKAGDVLLKLEDDDAKLQVREAEAELKAADARLAEVRELPKQHQARLAQQKAAIHAAQSRLDAANQMLTRKRNLHTQGHLSQEEVQAAADQVAELEAALKAERERLRDLELQSPEVLIDQAQEATVARQARLERARVALRQAELKAPRAGTVLRVLASPGDVLGGPNSPTAILFCPKQPRIVRAEVPQEFADRIREGQAVTVQNDTGAAEPWTGKVVRISDWFTRRRSILQEPLERNDVRTLECIIALDPGPRELRIGQRVRVTFPR